MFTCDNVYVFIEDTHGAVLHKQLLEPHEILDPDVFADRWCCNLDLGFERPLNRADGDFSVVFRDDPDEQTVRVWDRATYVYTP